MKNTALTDSTVMQAELNRDIRRNCCGRQGLLGSQKKQHVSRRGAQPAVTIKELSSAIRA